MPPAEVSETRRALDELDHTLLELVAKRRALVSALFIKKQALGLPRVDGAREAEMLADRRAYAERLGVPAELAEVIFRAILEDSHTRA